MGRDRLTRAASGETSRVARLVRAPDLAVTPYAYASIVEPEARIVFLAGACPLDTDGTVAAVGDYTAQAAVCIDNLVAALSAADATLGDVVFTRVLVASSRRDDLGAAWDVVQRAFGDHDVPSTLLGVTVLGYEHQLVEIEAVAALPR